MASSREVIKGELVLVAGVVLFLVTFVSLFFFYLRRKRYWGAYPAAVLPLHHQHEQHQHARVQLAKIDQSSIGALLPSTKIVYRARNIREHVSSEEEGLKECAVCLGELKERDSVRVLPSCGHVFHVSCIDKWLLSSASPGGCCCPLCRAPVLDRLPTA